MRTGESAFLRVREAAMVLGISNSAAYELANAWLATDGRTGLPAVRMGRRILIPRAAIDRLAAVGSDDRPRRSGWRAEALPWSCLDAARGRRSGGVVGQPDTAPAAATAGLGDPGGGGSRRGGRGRPTAVAHLGASGRGTTRGRPWHCRERRWPCGSGADVVSCVGAGRRGRRGGSGSRSTSSGSVPGLRRGPIHVRPSRSWRRHRWVRRRVEPTAPEAPDAARP